MRFVSRLICVFSFVAVLGAGNAFAGPVIIDGTDANEHGSFNGVSNLAGWEYMQRALTNLAAQLSSPTLSIMTLGMAPGGTAEAAFNSAFALSGLPGAGWTENAIDGAANITAALASLSTANTGILYIPTYGNAGGDLDVNEMAAVNLAAAQIAAFVNAGGALFAMGESGTGAWGWLTTLLPGLVATDVGGGGIGTNITLTAAGNAAFPGLTDADLAGADPWHGHFSGNLGSLSVLGTAADGNFTRNVIIGGGSGTVIQPTIPEPATLLLFGSGLAGLYRRRMRKNQA